ncbi:MAG: tetratricopeptide repeat protein [Acidobacteriota bacterium]
MSLSRRDEWIRRAFLLAFVFLCLATASCALPRIVVLHDPLTPEEHINLGLAYEKKGETEQAVGEYKKAAKDLPVAYLYLGNIYYGKAEYARAEEYYRQAIRKDSGLADAYNNLSWLMYTCGGSLEEAETLARKATELVPSNEIYQDTLAKVEEKRKREALPASRQ